jgi:hypothetical protein
MQNPVYPLFLFLLPISISSLSPIKNSKEIVEIDENALRPFIEENN